MTFCRACFLQVIVSLSWVHRGIYRRESAINLSNKGMLCPVHERQPILSKYTASLWGWTTKMCTSCRSLVDKRHVRRGVPYSVCTTNVWPVGGITTQQRGAHTCLHTHTQIFQMIGHTKMIYPECLESNSQCLWSTIFKHQWNFFIWGSNNTFLLVVSSWN